MATTDENVKLNPVEEAKVTSRYLRGTIGEELADGNDHFGKGSEALLKTHGTYQQDDRDARAAARAAGGGGKAEKSFIFMVRTRIPGGKMTSEQMLAELAICDELGNATLRITTRQGLQHHGIPKTTLKECIRRITDKLVKTDPANWRALRLRGDAYLSLGNQAAAIKDYDAALKIEPKEPGLLNNLAWVLATSPDDKLRDAKRARELAELACEATQYKLPHILSTLGAAYAEAGDFDGAKKWLLKALDLAADDDAQKDHLRKELASYEKREPWRELQTPDDDKSAGDKNPDEKKSGDSSK